MKTFHMAQSIRGAIWNREFDHFADDSGRSLSRREAFDHLCNLLVLGWKVIPFGCECDNFDPQTGCRGHEVTPSCVAVVVGRMAGRSADDVEVQDNVLAEI